MLYSPTILNGQGKATATRTLSTEKSLGFDCTWATTGDCSGMVAETPRRKESILVSGLALIFTAT